MRRKFYSIRTGRTTSKRVYDNTCGAVKIISSQDIPFSIIKLLINNGFKKVKLVATGLNIESLKKKEKMRTKSVLSAGSNTDTLRNKIENKTHLKAAITIINMILSRLGIGNALKGLYIKK